jgi:hypothetical protein
MKAPFFSQVRSAVPRLPFKKRNPEKSEKKRLDHGFLTPNGELRAGNLVFLRKIG